MSEMNRTTGRIDFTSGKIMTLTEMEGALDYIKMQLELMGNFCQRQAANDFEAAILAIQSANNEIRDLHHRHRLPRYYTGDPEMTLFGDESSLFIYDEAEAIPNSVFRETSDVEEE